MLTLHSTSPYPTTNSHKDGRSGAGDLAKGHPEFVIDPQISEGASHGKLQSVFLGDVVELTIIQNSMVDIPAFAKKAGLTPGSAKNVVIKLRKKIDDSTVGTLHTVTEAKVKKNTPKKAPATRKKKVENKIETKVESNEEDGERSE
jgi:hypothetical protein